MESFKSYVPQTLPGLASTSSASGSQRPSRPAFGYLFGEEPVDDPTMLLQIESFFADQMEHAKFEGTTEEYIEAQKKEHDMYELEREQIV